MAVTISLTGQIIVSDGTSGVVSLQKQLSAQTPGLVYSEATNFPIGTSPLSLSLPIALVQFVYIKNLHTANTITVTWTPSGGASNVVLLLQPLSMILFSEVQPVPTSGITAISLQSNVPNTQVEYLLAG